MSRVTLYFRFDDEVAAIAALAAFRVSSDAGNIWNASCIDAGVPIVVTPAILDALGEIETPAVMSTAYHVNVLLQERDEALEAIAGWLGTLDTETLELMAGDHPMNPQRVFA